MDYFNANEITQITLDLDNDSMFVYIHIELSSGKWLLKSFQTKMLLFDYLHRLKLLCPNLTY